MDKARDDFMERFNIPWSPAEKDEPPKGDIVLNRQLQSEISYLNELNSWWNENIKVSVTMEEVPKDSEANPGFLNSFYLNDLNYLSSLEEKKLGIALQYYSTSSLQKKRRKDLVRNKDLLFESFAPNLMTSGRWPSQIAYGLYSAQLGAVNTIFSNLRSGDGLQGPITIYRKFFNRHQFFV